MAEGLRSVSIRLTTMIAMIFIFVSSGAFGIEDMVPSSGPRSHAAHAPRAAPRCTHCHRHWSAPNWGPPCPRPAGTTPWARRAMGEFWGFQCGWWSWTCQWVDSAVYIALVQGYMSTWWPQLKGWELWLIGAALIVVFSYVNIRGLDIVAFSSLVFTIVILAPFVAMTILGWRTGTATRSTPSCRTARASSRLPAWGWRSACGCTPVSTPCPRWRPRSKNPQRLIPEALMIAVPLVVLSYVLPTLAGLAGVGHWQDWATTGGMSFVEVAKTLGGPILGYVMLGSAVISNLALYQDYLASGLPACLRDGRGPAAATRRSPAPTASTARPGSPSCCWPPSTWC